MWVLTPAGDAVNLTHVARLTIESYRDGATRVMAVFDDTSLTELMRWPAGGEVDPMLQAQEWVKQIAAAHNGRISAGGLLPL